MVSMLLTVHPVLASSDVIRSIQFYRCLGFSLRFQDSATEPKYAVIARDAVELHLQWHDAVQFDCDTDKPTYRFFVEDVDALFQEFLSHPRSAVPAAESSPWHLPAHTPWGTREFHVRDADGNGLQFYQAS